MNRQAILSMLVAGLVSGSYIEFQMNKRDDVVDVVEAPPPELPFEAVEWSPPMAENFQVEAPTAESTVIRFVRVEPVGWRWIDETAENVLRKLA